MKYEYTEEQQRIIDAALAKTSDDLNGFLTYEWSTEIVQRGKQTFALFGRIAREVMAAGSYCYDDISFDDVPVVVDGRMLLQDPDEGQSGVLYLRRITTLHGKPYSGEWYATYVPTAWLWATELKLSDEAIMENIEAEIDEGRNVFVSPPPGWQ